MAETRATAGSTGRELGEKRRTAEALHDQRRRLVSAKPELVDHLGNPVKPLKNNPVHALDRQIAELGDLDDLGARYEHSRNLENSAKQAWADYVRAHLPEIIDAERPEAERVTEKANAAFAAAFDQAQVFHEKVRQIEGYVIAAGLTRAACRDLRLPAEAMRLLEGWEFPVPLPEDS